MIEQEDQVAYEPITEEPVIQKAPVPAPEEVLPEPRPMSPERMTQEAYGTHEVTQSDYHNFIADSAKADYNERVGLIGARRDGALTEFWQGTVGGLGQFARSASSTLDEIGLVSPRLTQRIEAWQDVHQQYQVYEGAKPYSSWAAAMGYAGQVAGSWLPTFAIGGVFGKLGSYVGKAALFARSGTAIGIQAQFQGDDIKFFRDEVGLPPIVSSFAGFMTATTKTALNLAFGVERRITDLTANGMMLNALKMSGAAQREALNHTARQAMLAKIKGTGRRYVGMARELGVDVSGEGFTNMGELFIDDLMRHQWQDQEFHSFRDYFDTFAATIPGTLMFSAFGTYRAHRNEMMLQELTRPDTQEEQASDRKFYGYDVMDAFEAELGRLRGDLVKASGRMDFVSQSDAEQAAEIIGVMARRSARMISDRADGKAKNPVEYLQGFRIAVAERNLTPAEIKALRTMPNDRAMQFLYDNGIIDEVDRQRKNSDAEDAKYIHDQIQKDMTIELGTPEESLTRVRRGWMGVERQVDLSTASPEAPVMALLGGEQVRVTGVASQVEGETFYTVEGREQPVRADELKGIQPSLEAVTDQEIEERRVVNDPTPAKVEGAIPIDGLTLDAKLRATTNPLVFKSGDQFYSLRMLDDGRYGLVPTEGLTTVEQLTERRMAREAERARMAEAGVVVTEGGASVQPESASARDIQMYQGRVITPEGNTLAEATERHAGEVANVVKQEVQTKQANQLVSQQKNQRILKSLEDLPGGTRPSTSDIYTRPVEFMSAESRRVRIKGKEQTFDTQEDLIEAISNVMFEKFSRKKRATEKAKFTKAYNKAAREGVFDTAQGSNEWIDNYMRENGIDPTTLGMGKVKPATTKEGMYIASEQTAIFFENATSATILHEYFHHIDTKNLLPPQLKRALDKTFGDDPDRSERAAEAFTAYLLRGELPDGADPKLGQAFDRLAKIGAEHYQSMLQTWGNYLKPEVKAAFDEMFGGYEATTAEDKAIAKAVLASIEEEKSVDFMSVRKPEIKGYHTAVGNFAKSHGITREQARELLIDQGMKGYIYAKDDPTGTQLEDMSDEEMAQATSFMLDHFVGLAPVATPSDLPDADPEQARNDVLKGLATLPESPADYNDAVGLERGKQIFSKVRRMLRKGLMKSAMIQNITKVLDGMRDGAVTKLVMPRIRNGEDRKATVLNDVNKMISDGYAKAGITAADIDLKQIVDLGDGVQKQASKVAAIYMYVKGGWGKELSLRNAELTPEVIARAVKWVESDAGKNVREHIMVVKSVLNDLGPRLIAAAEEVGVKVNDLGEWYLPFMSEEFGASRSDESRIVESLLPEVFNRDPNETPQPGQTKTRSRISDIADRDAQARRLSEMGRLNLQIEDIFGRYVESTANYIGKAKNIKFLIETLGDYRVRDMVSRKFGGDSTWYDGMMKSIRSEMFTSGRDYGENALSSGERALQYIRGATTLSALGWRPRTTVVQPVALLHGLGVFAHGPRDVITTLKYFMEGLRHGEGFGKLTKLFAREQFAGWDKYEQMVEDHPQTKYRAFDPDYRDLQENRLPFSNNKFTRHALDGMRMVDMAGVVALYTSAKDSKLHDLRTQVENGQMTEQQANREAADFALTVIEKSQNPSNISQRSLFQKENEWMKGLNPFSGQRFVNFNYYMFDIVLPILESARGKSGLDAIGAVAKATYGKKRELAFAGAIPAVVFGMLYRMRPPEDEKEVFIDLLTYPMSTIPFVGQAVQSIITQKYKTYAYDPTMLGALSRSVVRTADTILQTAYNRSFEEWDWGDVNAMRRAAMTISGVPDYPAQVLLNFIREMGWENTEEGNAMLRVLGMPVEERTAEPVE